MSRDIAQIHKLKEDILAGNTTYSDVERRLSAAIEAEYDREDANIDFINACEDLLLEMHTDGELPSFPTSEEYAIEMQKHILVKKERSFLPKFAWRCAAVLATMLVIVLLGDQVFHWQWFSGTSTEDVQQYVIQGHEITIPMIAESIAEHEGEMIQTDDWQQVVTFLGFEPPKPDANLLSSSDVLYISYINPNDILLSIQYTLSVDEERYALFSAHYFTSAAEAYSLVEQSASGSTEAMNGIEVYYSNNLDQAIFTWQKDSTVFELFGAIDVATGLKVIERLIGGS